MVVTEDEPSDFRSSVKFKQIVVIGSKNHDLDQAKSQKSERFKNTTFDEMLLIFRG